MSTKKAAQIFNVSPQLFQSVADAMEGVVFVKDVEGVYQFVNTAYCRLLGLTKNKIIGKDDFSIFSPETAARLRENDKRIMQSKTEESIIENVELKGKTLTCRLSNAPLINEKGEVYGICGTAFEIIQNVKHENDPKITKIFLDNVVNNSLDSIILSNHDGRIIRVNRALIELTGYTKEELIERPSQFLSPQEAGTYQTTMGETIEIDKKAISRANDQIIQFTKTGRFQSSDGYLIRKDGKLVPVEINMVMLFGDNGKRIGTVATLKDISKYKESESKLKQTNFFLDSIIQNSVDCIIVTDTSGHIVRVNKAILDLLDYTEDKILGRALHSYLIPEEGLYESSTGDMVKIDEKFIEAGFKMIAELFEKGKVSNWEMCFFTRDKEVIPTEQNVAFFEDEKGERAGAVAIMRDITERKKAENEIKKHSDLLNEQVKQKTKELTFKNEQLVANYEQLLASEKSLIENEEKLRAIVRTASDAIITTDTRGNITTWNEAAEKIFGYSEKEILGKPALNILAERLREQQRKQTDKIREKTDLLKFNKQMESVGQRKNGEEFPMEFTMSVWKIEDHTYYTSIIRDITQKKQAEQEILETRDFLENIFETSADGIIVTDELGYIVRVNKALEKMTGYTEKELLQTHVKDLAPEYWEMDDITTPSEVVQKLKTGIRISDHQALWQRKDKSLFTVEASMSLLKENSENITGAVGTIRDITERQKIEDQLLRSEKLKSLGELAGGVAHDFNNVLAAILGRAQLLKRKVMHLKQEDESKTITEINKGLDIIEEAALDGAETIRRIQEFARKRADDKNFMPVDLNKIIKDALEFTKTRWKDDSELRGYKYSIKTLFSSLPFVEGSQSELREVFVNLINNSLDAMPKGGTIIFSSEVEENKISVKFKDTGKGIKPEVIDRIFDPFFTTKGPQSTGLGMSVSFGIITRHNGTITVESEVGKGTLFTITFPISEEKEIEPEDRPKKITQTRKAKILVADDEKEVLSVIRELLILEGHQVETANNGKEAVEIFSKKEFDLVFTDLGMPGMSGWEIADEIKKIKNVPVILMTGWEIKNNGVGLDNKKVDFLVSKPFKINEVLKAVKEGLELKDSSR